MVNQIPVPQAKYELLNTVRQTRWKSPVLRLGIILIIVGSLFAVRTWLDILSPRILPSSAIPECLLLDEDATIATWSRRARMYAESSKENQNADRNTTITTSTSNDSSSSKILICYYTLPRDLNSSRELRPAHIDPHICSHIIVGFASVVNSTLSLGQIPTALRQVVALRKIQPKLKVMISAGGINELHCGFPEMVKNHANRKKFIQSVLNITKYYDLDGLDIDWEFPAWLGNNERERIYFVQLLQETKKAFERSGRQLILSAAVAAMPAIIDESYNIPQIAEHVDFINLMAYDYHFYVWYLPLTGLNAPLYPRTSETGYTATMNVNHSVFYWMSKGMPREKIIVGIPTYGHSFKLDNPENHGIMAPAKGIGDLGEGGFTLYSTMCWFLSSGATKVFDKESKVPYAYKKNEWISYDDSVSVLEKSKWIKDHGLKGAMILSLNTDDWNASCDGNITFPLTRTIASVILYPSDEESPRGL